jgi:hypothetical protein
VTDNDISWKRPAGTFNLRAAAVITRGGDVLLGSVPFEPAGLVPVLRDLPDGLGHVVFGG